MKRFGTFLVFILMFVFVVAVPTFMTSAASTDPETTLGSGYEEDMDSPGEFNRKISKGDELKDLSKLADVNGDNAVNIKDATLIQKHLIQKSALKSEYRNRADVNGDFIIDGSDVTLIQKVIVGLETLRTK